MNAFIDCGRWRVHCTVQGEGPPLILLHGGAPGSSGISSFSRNIGPLSQAFTVYAIDFPGWGDSSSRLLPPGQFVNPMEVGGEVVAAFIQALGLGRAHLVGGSFGGSAALYTALNHPSLVDRLVLAAPGGGNTHGAISPGLLALLTYYSGDGPTFAKYKALMQHMVFSPADLPEALLLERYAKTATPEAADSFPLRLPAAGLSQPLPSLYNDTRLTSMEAPTLLAWGKNDAVQPFAALESFSGVPDQRSAVFDACGHWPYWEHADAFNETVLRFLTAP